MRKFEIQNFEYDLSRDILHNDDEMISLKHHSMIIYIGKHFKVLLPRPEEWNVNLSKAKKLTLPLLEEWCKLEKLVYEMFFTSLKGILFDLEFTFCVQKTIHFIGRQIIHFLFKTPCLSLVTMSVFMANVVFTYQGTINTNKTICRASRSFHEKYLEELQIMCSYYLGIGYIYKFYKSLPMKKKKRINVEQKDHIISFWMSEIYIPGYSMPEEFPREPDISECLPPSISDSNTYMFFEAIIENNDIGVEYLWNIKISEMEEREEILEKALNMILEDSTKINIMMFLLFQVNENKLSNFLKSKFITIIQNIIKKVRWHCVFIKLFHLLRTYFNKKDFTQIFGALIDSHCEEDLSGISLDTVVEYFTLLTDDVKIHITRGVPTDHIDSNLPSPQPQRYYERAITNAVLSSREDLLLKLLSVGNTEIKNFFKSISGITSLTEAAKEECLTLIYNVLKDLIPEDVNDIMFNFFIERKMYLCRYCIQKVLFNELKTFVDLCSGLERNRVARELLYIYGGSLLRETLFPNDKIPELDNFCLANEVLNWCLKSDQSVLSFKKNMNLKSDVHGSGEIVYYDKIRTCFINQQFDFLTSLFIWKGMEVEEKRDLFKIIKTDGFIFTYIYQLDMNTTFYKNAENFLKEHDEYDEVELKNLLKDLLTYDKGYL